MVLKRISVALLAACLLSASAWAELGPISVQSRLNEPFRAEVPLTNAATLDPGAVHTGLASRATFNQLNVNYQPELAWLSFALIPGENGPVVRIRSRRPIVVPNLQFVLQISGPGGSWVRSYAVKLEGSGAVPSRAAPGHVAATSAPVAKAVPAPQRTLRVTAASSMPELGRRILIKGVGLNRAMGALYQANRDKFVAGDPMRPRIGATLRVPTDAELHAMSEARARAIFRSTRNASAPQAGLHRPAPLKTPTVPASGHETVMPPTHAPVTPPAHAVAPPAHEGDSAHQPPAPGMSASTAAAMAASDAAASRQIKELKQQVDSKAHDLKKADKHIDDLKKRIQALEASQAAAAKAHAGGADFLAPKWLATGGGLLVLLLGLFFWRRRRGGKGSAKPKPAPKPLATTGVTPPDPTAATPDGTGDPLAEADVYLAYGHDDQAEKILRAALALHPGRQDIRAKLLEIYAARPDAEQFAELARDVHDVYDGRGAMWERTRAMGLAIDPGNPLYQPEPVIGAEAAPDAALDLPGFDTVPTASDAQTDRDAAAALESMMQLETPAPAPEAVAAAAEAGNGNNLLDFDFSIEAPGLPADTTADTAALIEAPPAEAVTEAEAATVAAGIDWPAEALADVAPASDAAAVPDSETAVPAMPEAAPVADPAETLVEAVEVRPSEGEEALATKLDLARVYMDMGDTEGAREVLQELQKEARGALRQQADEMLARIN